MCEVVATVLLEIEKESKMNRKDGVKAAVQANFSFRKLNPFTREKSVLLGSKECQFCVLDACVVLCFL